MKWFLMDNWTNVGKFTNDITSCMDREGSVPHGIIIFYGQTNLASLDWWLAIPHTMYSVT